MGRVTKVESNELTTSYIYDALGRIYTESEYDGDDYSVFRGYFYEGVSQYASQEITGLYNLLLYSDKSYEYDDEMRVVKVKESGEETVSYTYDKNGNKKSETLANGVVSTYTYNKANRITNIVNKNGNTTISSYEYSYYLDGSDACKKRNEGGIIETTEYEYDGLKRLEEESVKVGNNTTDTYSYEYDDYGNRSKMTATGTEDYVTEYSYNNAQGKYTALLQKEVKTVEGEENPLDQNSNVKQTVYTYDANGNQIKKVADGKTETNTYDGLNQLIGFTDGETEASYKYNASGLRYEKTVNGETINHVWDGSKQIIADVIDNQFYEADCYIRGTSLVAKYNYCNGTKSEYVYYTQNAHGDVVNLTNENGEVTKKYTYDAFGVEKNIAENDTNAFRYCGEYFDAETGTIYLRARYYNPTTGRFISRDSFAGKQNDPLSLNLYTYCANNPLIYVDPSGHSFKSWIKKKWNNYWDDWHDGIKILKDSGPVGNAFACYSEGVVDTISGQAESVKSFTKHPVQSVKNSVLDFISDPIENNPLTQGVKGIYGFYSGLAIASYNDDWDSVFNSLGSATVGIAETGVSASIAKGIKNISGKLHGEYHNQNPSIFGKNTIGAAEKYIPKNIKKVNDNYLNQKGFNAHEIKYDVLGRNAKISQYDIYVDKDTGELWVYAKGGKGEGMRTYENIKK